MSIEDEITPDIAALKSELWAIRFEMAREIMRRDERRALKWTKEEVALVRANLGKTDRQIAKAVSALGHKRTASAVKKKRREYEAAKRPSMGRKANDWPRVHGDVETQSKRFARALLEAMLAEAMAKRA